MTSTHTCCIVRCTHACAVFLCSYTTHHTLLTMHSQCAYIGHHSSQVALTPGAFQVRIRSDVLIFDLRRPRVLRASACVEQRELAGE